MNDGRTVKTLSLVWLALVVLLLATWMLSRLNLGPSSLAVALTIAFSKLFLIAAYFMELKWKPRTLWLISGVGLVWLMILMELTLTDYLTRSGTWNQ